METRDGLLRLKAALDGALAGLEGVENKKLFGCEGAFVGGNIFAIVWREGRLGLRLPDPERRNALLAEPGAGPWLMNGKPIRHWVLLPAAWHSDLTRLRRWGREAYSLALARPVKLRVLRKPGAERSVKAAVFKKLKRPERG